MRAAPTPAADAAVVMHYDRRLYDRVVQRLRITWDDQEVTVLNRFRDCEGHRPSMYSLLRFPKAVWTFAQSKRSPILPRPVPFLSFDAIRHLAGIVQPGWRVLEVGGGNSTLWFLEQGCEVVTVEHSAEWADAMRGFVKERDLGDRWSLVVAEGADALAAIGEQAEASFDLLLVDSMNAHTRRYDAMRAGRSKVREGGWLALDNSDFPINWCVVDELGAQERLRFSGYAPMSLAVCQTSFWPVTQEQ